MKIRLQKLISTAGVASRRAAEEMISAGKVTVNGAAAKLGDSADPDTDIILVDGKPLPKNDGRMYIMLNKPRGYVTTLSDEKGRRCVTDLVKDAGTRLYPVGRLDMYSEGLLLMTNDGDFANMLMHPSHNVKKTYRTSVTGDDIEYAVQILRMPMCIDGYIVKPAEVSVTEHTDDRAVLSITISEGRNRQVRKMCEQAGLKVMRLCRISEGSVELGDLPVGKWRRLTDDEINSFYK